MNRIGRYEGSHVYIFDRPDWPNKIVLARNNYLKQTTTPGFGRRGNLGFKKAAIRFTEEQTGLVVDDLELIRHPYRPSEAIREPNGVVQRVLVKHFLAMKVKPADIESRIKEHLETENGKKYQPKFVEVGTLGSAVDLAPEIPWILQSHFNLRYEK